MEKTPEITVRDNAESQCYDALIGDEVVGTIVYEHAGPRIVFMHTIVEPENPEVPQDLSGAPMSSFAPRPERSAMSS